MAHHLSETLPSSLTGLAPRVAENSSSGGSSVFSGSGDKTPLQRVFSNPSLELLNRVNEALSTFQQVGVGGSFGWGQGLRGAWCNIRGESREASAAV